MFVTTLGLYLLGSAAAAFAPNMYIFWALRFVAGMGIGGEYSAINSAIDELMPGKHRGRVDLAINGTYWAGAMGRALISSYFLAEGSFDENLGWRLAFLVGPILGLVIIYMRRHIPESFKFGVDAEGKALEEIAPPLSSYDEQGNKTLHIRCEEQAMTEQTQQRRYTVVVGINGSQQSRDALRWAKAQADLHDGQVIALCTWRAAAPAATPSGTRRPGWVPRSAPRPRCASVGRRRGGALGTDHGVELRVERSGRTKAFVELSRGADLIVLGAPRKLAAGPMFAHRLVYATHCPVVVMPPEPTGALAVSRAAGVAADRLATAAGTAGRPGMPPRPPAR